MIAGAFAAHVLGSRLDPKSLQAFETAVRYQAWHGLGLLAIGFLVRQGLAAPAGLSGWSMVAGIVLFSGSLYGLALGGPRWLGPITPIGGVCLIAAWICLFVATLRSG